MVLLLLQCNKVGEGQVFSRYEEEGEVVVTLNEVDTRYQILHKEGIIMPTLYRRQAAQVNNQANRGQATFSNNANRGSAYGNNNTKYRGKAYNANRGQAANYFTGQRNTCGKYGHIAKFCPQRSLQPHMHINNQILTSLWFATIVEDRTTRQGIVQRHALMQPKLVIMISMTILEPLELLTWWFRSWKTRLYT